MGISADIERGGRVGVEGGDPDGASVGVEDLGHALGGIWEGG